jgi:hypothetical protein
MTYRTAERIVTWALLATAARSGDNTGPSAPTCSSALASQLTLAIGAYASIDPASDGGCVAFPANASTVDSAEYLLVPQSAAPSFGASSPFALRAVTLGAAPMRLAQTLAPPAGPPTPAVQFDGMLRRLGREHAARAGAATSRPLPGAARLLPAAAPPALGSLRQFTVCANAASCGAPADFKTVGARVRAVGAHVAIYVDTLAPTPGLNSADVDTLRQVFDTLLYPLDSANFGPVSDLDANGVVIALMTPVVNALTAKAACSTSGYIAGFFFPADLDPTAPAFQTNSGEIFYSIVPDPGATVSCAHTSAEVKTGTPGTFAHEFQHMINFAQHTLIQIQHGTVSEEGWLDEGLSLYAEELTARRYLQAGDTATFSRLAINAMSDAYQYLSATGASPLLIEFDQGTLAERGASWLFARYLVDQYGAAVAGKLDQTTLAGAANVAAQTGHRFDSTLTRWALANWVSDLPGFATPVELSYTSWHFRTRTFLSLHQQDPNDFPLAYPIVPKASAGSVVSLSGTLRAGSGVYARALQAPGAPAFSLLFNGGGSAALPAQVVPRLSVIRIR